MFYVLYFPYYDTSLFVTPTWDGATVNRITLNYASLKNINIKSFVFENNHWVNANYKLFCNNPYEAIL